VATVRFCDKCGETHDVEETVFRRVIPGLILWKGDLCFDCRRAVMTFILKGGK
jgi:hypothetical protein